MKWYHIVFLILLLSVSLIAGFFIGTVWEKKNCKPKEIVIKDTVEVETVRRYPKYEKLDNVDISNPPRLSFQAGDVHVTYDSLRSKYFEYDLFIWSKCPVDTFNLNYKIHFYRWLLDQQTPTIQQVPTVTLQIPQRLDRWKVLWHVGVLSAGVAGLSAGKYKEVSYGLLTLEGVRLINEVWR